MAGGAAESGESWMVGGAGNSGGVQGVYDGSLLVSCVCGASPGAGAAPRRGSWQRRLYIGDEGNRRSVITVT